MRYSTRIRESDEVLLVGDAMPLIDQPAVSFAHDDIAACLKARDECLGSFVPRAERIARS